MPKPIGPLAEIRPVETIIDGSLRSLAGEMVERGYGLHGWAVRLIVEDFKRLASLEREIGLNPEQARRILLADKPR